MGNRLTKKDKNLGSPDQYPEKLSNPQEIADALILQRANRPSSAQSDSVKSSLPPDINRVKRRAPVTVKTRNESE